MDLIKHFELYRNNLKRGALEGCEDYAKVMPTARPQLYPTIFHYMRMVRSNLADAIETGNVKGYWEFLEKYQFAMVALFEKMVSEVLFDYDAIQPRDMLDLIHERGWNWFKFSKKALKIPVTFERFEATLHVVPRYSKEFGYIWRDRVEGAVFDADEMRLLFMKKDPVFSRQLIDRKLELPTAMKFDGKELCAIEDLNYQRVSDWALPMAMG